MAPTFKDIGKRMRGIPMLIDLDERFRVMDRFDDYQQILSIATPPIEVYSSGADSVDLARAANDGMAALVAKYPDRFPGFVASLPLGDPDAAMRETERAVGDLGARGIQMFSNINGKPLDRPEYLALFERMAAFDLPVWLHPFRGADISDYATRVEDRATRSGGRSAGRTRPASPCRGWCSRASSIAIPNLKIITHHLGAMAPYFEGRVGPGWDQLGSGPRTKTTAAVLKGLKKRPIDYFRMFYGDTAVFGAYDATVCGLNFFGAGHVLFASDAPFDPEKGPMYIRETIAILDRLPISEADRERIYWRNAVDLLRLPAG